MYQYQASKIHQLLWAAATEIEFRGATSIGIHYDPDEDLVDAFGAICLAAGAEPVDLLHHGDDVERVVAPVQVPRVLAAVDAMEGWYGDDITAWSDQREAADVAAGFRFVADKISVAVRV